MIPLKYMDQCKFFFFSAIPLVFVLVLYCSVVDPDPYHFANPRIRIKMLGIKNTVILTCNVDSIDLRKKVEEIDVVVLDLFGAFV